MMEEHLNVFVSNENSIHFAEMESPLRVIEGVTLKFPAKLWRLAHKCASGAISWNSEGNSVLIRRGQFESEFLYNSDFFKTQNFHSFIRQLNVYGFKKKVDFSRCYKENNDRIYEYQHANFKRDRPDLLAKVERKGKRTQSLKINEDALTGPVQFTTQLDVIDEDVASSSKLIPKNDNRPSKPLQGISHPLLSTPVGNPKRNRPVKKLYSEVPAPTANDMHCISPDNLHKQISDLLNGMDVIDDLASDYDPNQETVISYGDGDAAQITDSSPPSLNTSHLETPIIFLPSISPDNSFLMSSQTLDGKEGKEHDPMMTSALTNQDPNFTEMTSSSEGLLNQSLDHIDNILDCALQFYTSPEQLPSIDADLSSSTRVTASMCHIPHQGGDCQYTMGGTKIQGMFAPAYFDINSGTVTLYLPDNAGEMTNSK